MSDTTPPPPWTDPDTGELFLAVMKELLGFHSVAHYPAPSIWQLQELTERIVALPLVGGSRD